MTTYEQIVTSDQWECESCSAPLEEHVGGICPFYTFQPATGFIRRHIPFVGMLRIKDEARWIAEVIEAMLPLCQKIFVLDDRSTDDTKQICQSYSEVTVYDDPFEGLDEARDKNWLCDQIYRYCQPGWILAIDGDEVLEKKGPTIIREHCERYADAIAFRLKIAWLWNDRHTERVDRVYGDFWRPSLFKPVTETPGNPDTRRKVQEFRFQATPFGRNGANLHCSSVPQRYIHEACWVNPPCPARLKHLGYIDRADRVRKLDYYTSIDWKNAAEDCYRHMCQGDAPRIEELPRTQQLLTEGIIEHEDVRFLTDVSPDMKLAHAGPLVFQEWDEDASWEPTAWARRV